MWWDRNPNAFWGALLVIVGLLFLLANTGVLSQVSWAVVWPVLLIALGVWLVSSRLGRRGSNPGADYAEPRDGLSSARLEVAVGAARIEVRAAQLDDMLYTVHAESAGNRPEVTFDRGSGTLRIRQRFDWFFGARRLEARAQLSDAVPWEISCSTGALNGAFDLSAGRLSRFECRTGASRIDLVLPRPQGQVPLRIDGGALTVGVVRPAASALKVRASAGAVQLKADGSRQDGVGGREWTSPGYDAAADRYDLTVSGGAVNLTVEQR